VVNQVSKTDVTDSEFLDAEELQSTGTFIYLTTTVVSTTSGTKTVVINLPSDGEGVLYGRDHPAQAGDFVVITGTSGALGDGTFTIASVPTDTSFVVVETIGTSTGGSVDFYYQSGAKKIGLSNTGMTHVTTSNVQDAISELDSAVSGGITADQHKVLRQLIHLADEGGPYEGFPTGVYQETLPSASPFPTSVIWWTDSGKTMKIVEEVITYNGNKTVNTDQWLVYSTDGVTVLATVTDTIVYSGVFELHRTRAIV
jgi:hypothetical protein